MAYALFFNPMSRALIAQWGFAEAGVEPELVQVDWDNKPAALLQANPMGKVPTIIHHASFGDRVITETPAICHYLAEMEAPALLPGPEEKAHYWRWLFFAAGPMEAAVTNKALGWEPRDARQQMTTGFGSYERVVDTLDIWLQDNAFVCGNRFTMVDVIVGSQVDWGLRFGTLEDRLAFRTYQARLHERPAYRASIGKPGS